VYCVSLKACEAVSVGELREASALLEMVWGRTGEGVPVNSEVMKSLVHAGGCVTVARDGDGRVVGAAVLSPAAPAGAAYSLIAGVAPGMNDRGIGRALKLRQREWALEHGFTQMAWTFDPLVARNARFNLARLGAVAQEYEVAFYGRMSDDLNGDDESDRLVARWSLAGGRAAAAAAGTAPDHGDSRPAGNGPDDGGETLRDAPDGGPLLRRDPAGLWCRVPADIVALRRADQALASRWRRAVRDVFRPAFADGYAATYCTRAGWYLLAPVETVSDISQRFAD
jgi:predicted GNAT superfamily acetyltransferase